MKIEITTIVLKNPNDDIRMLKNALSSVLNQSVPVDEIIVVDCGYDDKLIEMIEEIQKEGNNVRFIAECKDDRMMRRVHGAKKAHHDWITFLNSDDVWISDKIENQLRILQSRRYKKDSLILTNWYDGSIYPDAPKIIDTVIGGPCYRIQAEKDEILMQYASHMFSGMFLSKFLLMKTLDSCSLENDWQLFQKLLESGNIIYLPYTYYIHKSIKSKDYMKAGLEEICNTLMLKKDMIVSSYGIAYWNEKIRKIWHEPDSIMDKGDLLPLFSLFDFGDVEMGTIEEIRDIDKYVYEKEVERLAWFFSTHKRIGCYGAGDYGRKLLGLFKEEGKSIDCVIVSDGYKSQEELLDIIIVERSELDLNSLDGIIVAMNLNTFPEVMRDLRMKYSGDVFTVTPFMMSFLN